MRANLNIDNKERKQELDTRISPDLQELYLKKCRAMKLAIKKLKDRPTLYTGMRLEA